MSRRILITGGAGFIGSHLSKRLTKQNFIVTVLDNLSPQVHGNGGQSDLYFSIRDKVIFVNGDVRNINDWAKVLPGQDVIVHFAAETGTGQSMYDVSRYSEVNVQGTAHLLHYLINEKHSIQKVIIASSRAIYGEGKYICDSDGAVYPGPRKEADLLRGKFECLCPHCGGALRLVATDEESKLHPVSIYGITKQTQEQLVLTVCQSIGISAMAIRYQNVYGPGQSLSNPYTGILSIFSTRIANDGDINIFEDGQESRDFVYIEDAIDATVLAIEKEDVGVEAINIGSGRAVSVLKVAEAVAGKCSQVRCVVSGNFRMGDIRHNFADIRKAETLLGFRPKWSFESGVKSFLKWAYSQSIRPDDYERSLLEMKSRGLLK